MTAILGLSAYYHDSAAAIIVDGELIAAAQEERFTRKKHDADFPAAALQHCLQQANITLSDLDHIAFYDKPLLKFDRLLETYLAYCPRGFQSYSKAMPVWLKGKLNLKHELKKEFTALCAHESDLPQPFLFTRHHQSHAASAFYPSPYEKAAVICLDGVGEWATTSVWLGEGNQLTPQWELQFPHSLGLLYSAFTYYLGFRVNSGEYKVMGLAPYGQPHYADLIIDHLIDLKEDGTFRLNMKYFNYSAGLTMTNRHFDHLFGAPPRLSEGELSQRDCDIAASIQQVTEKVVLRLCNTVLQELGTENLCLAGGVALNCVANGRIQRETAVKNLWVQPAAGDAGGAIGAAYASYHQYLGQPRVTNTKDAMSGCYLGPAFNDDDTLKALATCGADSTRLSDNALYQRVAQALAEGKVVGWFQGHMEFGPRALGNRSILADPRDMEMQLKLNLKIKYRESFRPFAPAVLAEKSTDYFDQTMASPYMLSTCYVKPEKRCDPSTLQLTGIEQLKVKRSELPAVTHVDYSARVQTVHVETNSRFHALLTEFEQQTGCPCLINTSFNVRGEPIVCTPTDAYRCFMNTEMDILVIGNHLLLKTDQPQYEKQLKRQEFTAD